MIWLQMDELGKKQELGRLYSDSHSAIHIANNSIFHSKAKHIQLKYHFIWSVLYDGQLKLEKIHTNQNPADMLTKVVTREKLRFFSIQLVFKYDEEDENKPGPKWRHCLENEATIGVEPDYLLYPNVSMH